MATSDPSRPILNYGPPPPHSRLVRWSIRWARRGAVLLLVFLLIVVIGWIWLYRQWSREQAILARVRATYSHTEPLGGETGLLVRWTGPAGFVLQRVDQVKLPPTATDADLPALRGLPHLQDLVLNDTRITDAGLICLRDLPKLDSLEVGDTAITDAGLTHLAALKGLQDLTLTGTPITDAGLSHLARLTELRRLFLDETAVSDAGLVHLEKLRKLRYLDLTKTRVSELGVRRLERLLGFPPRGIESNFFY